MAKKLIKAGDIADIIDSIIYNDSEAFESILERGFDTLEEFAE